LCGYAEQLEFLATLPEAAFRAEGADRKTVLSRFREVAEATAEYFIAQTPTDGVPYWDTGAPGLARMGDYLDRPAEPFNDFEPVDSSAAAITSQGLIRLGNHLAHLGESERGSHYRQAGLTVARTLFAEPYLSTDPAHEGLLLHAQYHRPNGWDHVPEGRRVPCGESVMWGDYHVRELALLVLREAEGLAYPRFFLD
jgi:hypothetical protein